MPRNLWSPKVHYRVHNSHPIDATLDQTNPFHTVHLLSLKTRFNATLLYTHVLQVLHLDIKYPSRTMYTFLLPQGVLYHNPISSKIWFSNDYWTRSINYEGHRHTTSSSLPSLLPWLNVFSWPPTAWTHKPLKPSAPSALTFQQNHAFCPQRVLTFCYHCHTKLRLFPCVALKQPIFLSQKQSSL
jgi:hypothetical protein